MLLEHSTFFDTIKIQVLKKLHTLCSSRQISGNVTDMVDSNAKTFIELMKKLYNKACLCELSHKGSNTDATHLVPCYNHSPPASMQTSCTPEEPAKTDLPLLPGGATILCHFWNSVVFRQSRGLSAYALWRDISSCIGSKITHSCKIKNK